MNPYKYFVIIGNHAFECSYLVYRLFRASSLKEEVFDVDEGSVFTISKDKSNVGISQIIDNRCTVCVMEI